MLTWLNSITPFRTGAFSLNVADTVTFSAGIVNV